MKYSLSQKKLSSHSLTSFLLKIVSYSDVSHFFSIIVVSSPLFKIKDLRLLIDFGFFHKFLSLTKVGGFEMADLRADLPFSCISLNGNISRSFFRQKKIDEESTQVVSFFLKHY